MKFKFLYGPLRNEAGENGGEGGGGAVATAEQTPAPLIGDDLSFAEDWQARVGENAEGLSFKNLSDMAKSAKEAQTKITELSQANAELKKQVGGAEIPKTVEDFTKAVALPQNLPEGITVPDDLVRAGVEFAIEKGHSPQVVSDFIEFQAKQAGAEFDAERNDALVQIEQAKVMITNAVGPQNFDQTISDAKAASEMLGLDLDSESLVSNPKLVIALSKINEKLSPGTLRGAGLGGPDGNGAKGKLSQAEDILTNENNPHYAAFNDSSHPGHEAAMAEYNRLIYESAE